MNRNDELDKIFRMTGTHQLSWDPFAPENVDAVDLLLAAIALNPGVEVEYLTQYPEEQAAVLGWFDDCHTYLGSCGGWACDMADQACDRGWRDWEELTNDHAFEELMQCARDRFWEEGFKCKS